jgi:hypothetical protein
VQEFGTILPPNSPAKVVANEQLLFGLSVLPFATGVAVAGQPVVLNDAQLDLVTAAAKPYEGMQFASLRSGQSQPSTRLPHGGPAGGSHEFSLQLVQSQISNGLGSNHWSR